MDAFAPYASYAKSTLCWGCYTPLHPDLAKSKVRKEHLVLSELERRCIDIFEQCGRATWDCAVEGGCSLKRPDLALDFGTHVVVIEVDELQHDEASCWDEDTRLAVIAADFQKPVAVIRLRVDTPVPCFRRKRLSNGEPAWAAIEAPFSLIMSRAEVALREDVARHDDYAETWRRGHGGRASCRQHAILGARPACTRRGRVSARVRGRQGRRSREVAHAPAQVAIARLAMLQ